jgi:hypothetical protein
MARTKTTRTAAEKAAATTTGNARAKAAREAASKFMGNVKKPFVIATKSNKKPRTKALPYQYFKVPSGQKGKVFKFRSRCNPRPGTICHAASAYAVAPKIMSQYRKGPTVSKGTRIKALTYNRANFK